MNLFVKMNFISDKAKTSIVQTERIMLFVVMLWRMLSKKKQSSKSLALKHNGPAVGLSKRYLTQHPGRILVL